MYIHIKGKSIPVTEKRSSRKTISLEINEKGEIILRMPRYTNDRQRDLFLSEHLSWIEEHLETVLEMQRKLPHRTYEDGTTIAYLGEEIPLKITDTDCLSREEAWDRASEKAVTARWPEERHTGNVFLLPERVDIYRYPGETADDIKDRLRIWYTDRFAFILKDRLKYYSAKLKVVYRRVNIKQQKTRWGSCSSRGSLNFNWLIVMAPPQALDYVVVHELCHLRHMDHSREFWKEVESVYPDYRRWDRWYRDHGMELTY